MIALSEAFETALKHHRAGQTQQAEEICRSILKEDPDNAPTLNLLGVLMQKDGRDEEALPFLRRAIAARPEDASYHFNLGAVQQLLGQKAEAMASYREALRLNPDHAGALNNFGHLALNLDELEQAEDYLRHALRVQPEHGPAHHNLGLVCKRRGKLDEAITCLRNAVRFLPNDGMIHFHFGQLLEERGLTDDAIRAFRESVRLQPDNADSHCWLGNMLTKRRQLKEALHHYEIALRLQPEAAAHHSNLGNVLTQLGRPQEAETACREAIRLHAEFANAHYNLANALGIQGRLDEALQCVEEAIRIEPEHSGAHNSRALWRLQLGRFAEGWPEYEWRWKMPDMSPRQCREPLWDGSPLNGKTILLWAEQGLGDTLQSIRLASLVKQRGGTVIVESQAALVPLLSRCAGIDHLIARGSPVPEADVQAPLMSLPWLLGIKLEELPAVEVPYLFPDPDLVEKWKRELSGPPRLRIGIAWQGNPLYSGDCMRSIPLKHFAALAHLPGVRLFSLQKGIGSEQLQTVSDQFYVVDLSHRLDETTGAFMDTAAVMQSLDLIVTSDTSIAHLAGGLGVPVWVALSIGCDWRFFHLREDNPWYPTMRLFRQTRFGDWDEVFARIADEVSNWARQDRAESGKSEDASLSPADLAQKWTRALAHFESGQHAEAEQICEELLAAESCHGDALNLMGVLAHQAGQNELARQRLERAVVLRPNDGGFHYNLGVARQMLGQTKEAADSYRQTLRFQPNHPTALNNLGHACLALGQDAEARQYLEQAVRLQPDYAEAYINLGSACLRLGDLEQAAASLKQAVRLRPDDAASYSRLGIAAQKQGRLHEAVTHFEEAVQLSPNLANVHHNLGLALMGTGRYDEARTCFDEAIRLDPQSDARFVRAMILLLQGDFEQGWREYEQRWQSQPTLKPAGPEPLWDGSPLDGKTILLWAEQGLGDTIQFIRYASLVKEQGGTVFVQCPAPLIRLLSTCPGADRLVAQNQPLPNHDFHAPLLSLPHILDTTLETIPADVPYVFADKDLVERWRQELSSLNGFRVGIAWQGRPTHLWDRDRSVPLHHFAPLAQVPGVRLISLQKGPGQEQLREVEGLFSVYDPGPRLDESGDAFVDTAAVMKSLDLVITSDTSVAHLAGALGVPVWVALSFAPDWRWLLERDDSPWYPSMRLFRQQQLGEWREVFERMAAELFRQVRPDTVCQSIPVEIAPGELLDKITILELKQERIHDSAKLKNVAVELATLKQALEESVPVAPAISGLTADLKAVNAALWDIEDDIRRCEQASDFGPRFIELARSVYRQNDRRAALKRAINDLLGSRIIEEKSYADYAVSLDSGPMPRSFQLPVLTAAQTDDRAGGHQPKRTGRLATICILTFGDYLAYFQRCLESVLAHTPWDAFELRLGFNEASQSWDFVHRRLPAEGAIEIVQLPGGIERWSYQAVGGLPVSLWNSPVNLYKEPMCRLLYHDRPLTTEYAVWFDDDSYVEQGWWEALAQVLDRRIDYVGQFWWAFYFPGQAEMIRSQPWYRGKPFEVTDGYEGVRFCTGGFVAIRAARLREVGFPDTEYCWKGEKLKQYGGDTMLGEIARQLEWSIKAHDAYIHINVDLLGRHPAPRRGGTGRQFGSDIDDVIR